jgi:hypothetical protein
LHTRRDEYEDRLQSIAEQEPSAPAHAEVIPQLTVCESAGDEAG